MPSGDHCRFEMEIGAAGGGRGEWGQREREGGWFNHIQSSRVCFSSGRQGFGPPKRTFTWNLDAGYPFLRPEVDLSSSSAECNAVAVRMPGLISSRETSRERERERLRGGEGEKEKRETQREEEGEKEKRETRREKEGEKEKRKRQREKEREKREEKVQERPREREREKREQARER